MSARHTFEKIVQELQSCGAITRVQAETMSSPDKVDRIIPLMIEENIDAGPLAQAVAKVMGYPCYEPDNASNNPVYGNNYVLCDGVAYLVNPLGPDQQSLIARRKTEHLAFNAIGVLPYNLLSSANTSPEEEDKLTVKAEELLNLLINDAIRSGASDIHIKPQYPETLVLFRQDGRLTKTKHRIQLGREYEHLANKILMLCDKPGGAYQAPVSGRIPYTRNGKSFPIRVEMNPVQVSENPSPRFVLRIPGQAASPVMQLPRLGLSREHHDVFEVIARAPDGLVLVTGPTGSGKTTTLYALLSHISDQMPYKSVSTLEDPVEVEIPKFNQIQIQEDQSLSFANGIRSLLRSDPDVMLVGEIRDEETGVQALRAAITGHLVLSTLHTKDAVKAIGRLQDLGLSNKILADALLAVTAQRMVRKLCSKCAKPVVFQELHDYYERYSWMRGAPDGQDEILTHNEYGCDCCRGTGYSGRMSINEIMVVDDVVAGLIADGGSALAIRQHLAKAGHKDLWDDGMRIIKEGKTCFTEVESVLGIKARTSH